jgi:hypothetical protein
VTKLRRMRLERYVASTGEMQNAYTSLVRKTEFRRPLWIATWMVLESNGLNKRLAVS